MAQEAVSLWTGRPSVKLSEVPHPSSHDETKLLDEGGRLYRVNGHALKPIHDWVSNYERTWSKRFEQLDDVLEELKQKEQGDGSDDE